EAEQDARAPSGLRPEARRTLPGALLLLLQASGADSVGELDGQPGLDESLDRAPVSVFRLYLAAPGAHALESPALRGGLRARHGVEGPERRLEGARLGQVLEARPADDPGRVHEIGCAKAASPRQGQRLRE